MNTDDDFDGDDWPYDDSLPEWTKSVAGVLLVSGVALAVIFTTTYLLRLIVLGLIS
jgi:hypothetical protein